MWREPDGSNLCIYEHSSKWVAELGIAIHDEIVQAGEESGEMDAAGGDSGSEEARTRQGKSRGSWVG